MPGLDLAMGKQSAASRNLELQAFLKTQRIEGAQCRGLDSQNRVLVSGPIIQFIIRSPQNSISNNIQHSRKLRHQRKQKNTCSTCLAKPLGVCVRLKHSERKLAVTVDKFKAHQEHDIS